jgi:hypothetical protein
MKYESPITYNSKDMANVKILQTDRQTDRQTERPKTTCPLSFDTGA